jgi:excisionase family DNA binding protein
MTQAEVLTMAQACALLQLCRTTIRKMALRGDIPYRRAGREWRFGRESLLRWVNGN